MAYTTINKSSLYQNTVLYTGDTSSSRSITGVGFQPDLVWVKTRNAANPHLLSDSVRGTNNNLQADSDAIASTSYAQGWVSAFGADGYTAQAGGSGDNDINGNTNTYASWNWKANGAGSANTDGSINSTVSVNTTAGFSIVKWTGNVTSGATVGHGLGATPKMIIVKNMSSAQYWCVYHEAVGNTKALYLNDHAVAATSTGFWNDTSPTNSVFYLGNNNNTNGSGNDLIAYCFAEISGYSKFGSYYGNSSTDGVFNFTGFKPQFVLIKNTTGNNSWELRDNQRQYPYNLQTGTMYVNNNGVEDNGEGIDMLSNGFKCRASGGGQNNGNTFIYMAFGQTLVGTNNVPCTAR